ncbi:unnamed protein product [Mytilus coruscus]|uniref:Uncharacterized protein n=1 Tax=Mytilus coruscus TaxID=42192 RepID=A0A6J8D7W7_MYTCO|nr:unnamed protein product [Mytilus coruscus]
MTNANRGSCVMLYTDADPKDRGLLSQVRALIISKNLHLLSFITGSCSGALSKPDMHFKCATGKENHRKRREVLDDSFYELLGGDTFIVPDRKISEPLDTILEHNMGLKHVTTWKATLSNDDLDIFIDVHIQAFTIEIKGPRASPKSALKNPSGSNVVYTGDNNIDDLGKSTYKISIIHPVAGTWSIENTPSETWTVTVKLQGSITFMQYFLEDVYGTLLPIMGSSPLSESNVTLKVDVEGLKEEDSVLYVHLLDNSRQEIESYNLTYYEEAGEMIGMAPIQIPDQPFKVMIHGSSEGSDYRRELADVITPSSAELIFEKNEVAVYTWKITNFTIRVVNTGSSEGRYQLKLTDTSGFISSSPLITYVTIKSKSSKDVSVHLQGKLSSKTSGSCCTPKFTLFLIDNEYLQADRTFDFTDGNIFITSDTLKVNTNSEEHQGFTTTAFYGVIGGIVAALLTVVIIVVIWFNCKTSRNVGMQFSDTKENVQNNCQRMNRAYLQYFAK